MESFLQSIERPAYRVALIASRNREDALDLVQEAMCKFVEKYASRSSEEWKPLFYRILHNGVRDLSRRRKVRSCLRWIGLGADDDRDPWEQFEDARSPDPEHQTKVNHASRALQQALAELPLRQQQVFLLRGWEELSVAETATSMGCAEGSVKTHYSRAVHALREKLGDYWP